LGWEGLARVCLASVICQHLLLDAHKTLRDENEVGGMLGLGGASTRLPCICNLSASSLGRTQDITC